MNTPWITVTEDDGTELILLDPSNPELVEKVAQGGWEMVGLHDYMGCTFLAYQFFGKKPGPLAI